MSVRVAGTQKTLEANGASISNGNVGVADDANYSVASDGAGYAHVELALAFTCSTAPTEHASIDVWLRPLDFDGTNDAEIPENGSGFKGNWYAGSILCNNVTTAQYGLIRAFDVPPNFTAYILNGGGQTISSGWTLKATPVAYKAAS